MSQYHAPESLESACRGAKDQRLQGIWEFHSLQALIEGLSENQTLQAMWKINALQTLIEVTAKGQTSTSALYPPLFHHSFHQSIPPKYRWKAHTETQKHMNNEMIKKKEEELSKMNEEETDEHFMVKKLKKIWHNVRL